MSDQFRVLAALAQQGAAGKEASLAVVVDSSLRGLLSQFSSQELQVDDQGVL